MTDLVEIATQAAEAAAGIGSIINGFEMVSLSRDYYNLYRDQREFYYNVFQHSAETPLVNEILGIPIYYKDYAGRILTLYNANTGPFGGKSGDALGWWSRHGRMFGLPMDPSIKEYEPDIAKLKSDWTNYLFRFEEHWADVRNDDRWAKRMMAHNVGIKQGTAVSGSLGNSLSQYQQHIADMSSQLATWGNGIARYAGYKRGLADTSDNFSYGTTFSRVQIYPLSTNPAVQRESL